MGITSELFKWLLFNLTVAFAVYWASNLLLWFPWSIRPWLGMTLMLTVSPVIWVLASYKCLEKFPGIKLMKAALINALVLLTMAVLMDYIFFGLIRDAMDELYHPTTLYGYGFVAALPFMLVLLLPKRLEQNQKVASKKDFLAAGIIGAMCFGLLILIIVFGIEIRV